MMHNGRNAVKHDMSRHPAYSVWQGMRRRCQQASYPTYDRYGGRGIRVYERWQQFELFWADMGPTHRPGLSIERQDNNGHYEPGNCMWATPVQQCNNKRNNVLVWIDGQQFTLVEAARYLGLTYAQAHYRFHAGRLSASKRLRRRV